MIIFKNVIQITKGKTFGIKDSVMVAGFPCRNGSNLLQDFICQQDATVVQRILAAGGTIVGKTQCEYQCHCGSSFTSWPKPVLNPNNSLYSAGGSSSGSAVAVHTGACDMAIGGDQGGSVRLPSCWTGVVGHKGTYGYVPYTGAFSLGAHFDHLGAMARTVDDCALLYKQIVGRDGYDVRQMDTPMAEDDWQTFRNQISYACNVNNCKNITIGVVKEGFENGCETEVEERVKYAVQMLGEKCDAKIVDVSIPIHNDCGSIWIAIGCGSQYLTYLQFDGISHLPKV